MSSQEIKPLKVTGEHSYHRRAISHNYHAPFIYHIILKKKRNCEIFGSVTGDARIAAGQPGCVTIKESELGRIIVKSILHLPYLHPIIKLYQFCVMPDHVHILLQVTNYSEKHLDFYIDSLKKSIATRYSTTIGSISPEEIFEQGYCDKPLYENRSLDTLFRYIRENPYRLAVRQQFPQFFQRVRQLQIAAPASPTAPPLNCEAYGNLFLLRNPDKEAVKISSKFTPEETARKKAAWLSGAAKGTILVSPFISAAEKAIRTEAEALDAPVILITHEAFGDRYKPADHDFALCAGGRLLIISLGLPAKAPLTRALCLQMNALAETIAYSPVPISA